MNFDPVHDTQAVYRILLDCMSLPGKTGSFASFYDHINLEAPLDKGLLLLALTLLDGETSCCIPRQGVTEDMAEDESSLARMEAYLARICSCPIKDSSHTAFLFLPLLRPLSEAPLSEAPLQASGTDGVPCITGESDHSLVWASRAIEGAFRGTFMEPHLGATAVVMIGSLILHPEDLNGTSKDRCGDSRYSPGGYWILEGPGVNGSSLLACDPGDRHYLQAILAARGQACSEFPLGVDLMLLDRAGRIVCLPRTTSVKEY